MAKRKRKRPRQNDDDIEIVEPKKKNIFIWPISLSLIGGIFLGLIGLLESGTQGAIRLGMFGILLGLLGGFAVPFFENSRRHNISEYEPNDDTLHRLYGNPHYLPPSGFKFNKKRKKK